MGYVYPRTCGCVCKGRIPLWWEGGPVDLGGRPMFRKTHLSHCNYPMIFAVLKWVPKHLVIAFLYEWRNWHPESRTTFFRLDTRGSTQIRTSGQQRWGIWEYGQQLGMLRSKWYGSKCKTHHQSHRWRTSAHRGKTSLASSRLVTQRWSAWDAWWSLGGSFWYPPCLKAYKMPDGVTECLPHTPSHKRNIYIYTTIYGNCFRRTVPIKKGWFFDHL